MTRTRFWWDKTTSWKTSWKPSSRVAQKQLRPHKTKRIWAKLCIQWGGCWNKSRKKLSNWKSKWSRRAACTVWGCRRRVSIRCLTTWCLKIIRTYRESPRCKDRIQCRKTSIKGSWVNRPRKMAQKLTGKNPQLQANAKIASSSGHKTKI